MKRKRTRGFSLIEVVVAVGIFAFAIVGVLGLLTPTGKAITEVADNDAASRAIGAIQAGLQQTGFTNIKKYLDAQDGKFGYLYSSKSGDKVGVPYDKGTTGLPSPFSNADQQFFEVALTRDKTLSPGGAADDTAGFLAFTVTLRWPAFLPNGVAVPDEQKSQLTVPAAVTR